MLRQNNVGYTAFTVCFALGNLAARNVESSLRSQYLLQFWETFSTFRGSLIFTTAREWSDNWSLLFYSRCFYNIITIIIIKNIKDWTLWSVPSPELQLLAPTLLRSSNCSPSLWSVVVWFQRDSVLLHSLQVWTL